MNPDDSQRVFELMSGASDSAYSTHAADSTDSLASSPLVLVSVVDEEEAAAIVSRAFDLGTEKSVRWKPLESDPDSDGGGSGDEDGIFDELEVHLEGLGSRASTVPPCASWFSGAWLVQRDGGLDMIWEGFLQRPPTKDSSSASSSSASASDASGSWRPPHLIHFCESLDKLLQTHLTSHSTGMRVSGDLRELSRGKCLEVMPPPSSFSSNTNSAAGGNHTTSSLSSSFEDSEAISASSSSCFLIFSYPSRALLSVDGASSSSSAGDEAKEESEGVRSGGAETSEIALWKLLEPLDSALDFTAWRTGSAAAYPFTASMPGIWDAHSASSLCDAATIFADGLKQVVVFANRNILWKLSTIRAIRSVTEDALNERARTLCAAASSATSTSSSSAALAAETVTGDWKLRAESFVNSDIVNLLCHVLTEGKEPTTSVVDSSSPSPVACESSQLSAPQRLLLPFNAHTNEEAVHSLDEFMESFCSCFHV